ncbi:MAG: sugar transferase [Ilumatobacter sp.]|nr:sugar transferase [Ilumatobacter sp.]MDJ0768715.1 sugar transferase [Ilumatobacter sp.]
MDVTVAACMLLVTAPAMLLIAAAIRLTSRGPALFRQARVGHHGESFSMLKFRTMADGTHEAVLACDVAHGEYARNAFKLPPDDPRITRVGRFLRATSLDELPQMINVLRGEMSIVGVRPVERAQLLLRPPYVQDAYRSMRPGLTGLWQTSGRSSLSQQERDALDVDYVENWSPTGDIRIILRTPAAMIRTHETH